MGNKNARGNRGKTQSKEAKEIRSKAISLLKWYNNGEKNVRTKKHPGEGWIPGRAK